MPINDARKLEIKSHTVFLSTVIKETQAEFGKQILSLSSGVLALSAAFIKNVVNVSTAKWILLIYSSWVFLLAAVLLTLAAMRMSSHAHKTYKSDLEKMIKDDREYDPPTGRAERWMPHFVRLATACFALGFISLVCFSIVNLHKDRAMSNNSSVVTHGFTKPDGTQVRDTVEVQRLPNPAPQPAPAAPPPPAETPEKK